MNCSEIPFALNFNYFLIRIQFLPNYSLNSENPENRLLYYLLQSSL